MGVAKGQLSAKQRAQALELSDRGTEVMSMALNGMTWTAIGQELGIAPGTARNDVIKANRAALQKRDELAEQNLAIMTASLQEGANFCLAIVENVQGELAEGTTTSADKKSKLEKRALLALDRLDKLIHRHASLTGLYPHDGGNKLVLQGIGTVQLTLGAAPAASEPEPPTIEGHVVSTRDHDKQ